MVWLWFPSKTASQRLPLRLGPRSAPGVLRKVHEVLLGVDLRALELEIGRFHPNVCGEMGSSTHVYMEKKKKRPRSGKKTRLKEHKSLPKSVTFHNSWKEGPATCCPSLILKYPGIYPHPPIHPPPDPPNKTLGPEAGAT